MVHCSVSANPTEEKPMYIIYVNSSVQASDSKAALLVNTLINNLYYPVSLFSSEYQNLT